MSETTRRALAFLLFLASFAYGQEISILGVTPAMRAPENPGAVAPAPAPQNTTTSTTASACGLDGAGMARLATHLHGRGQKTALIVRGSKLGIHENVRQLIARIAAAFAADPDMRAFLEKYLAVPYLTDESPTIQALSRMGFKVEMLASSDMQGNPVEFKNMVLRALSRPEVSLVVFYGHGNPDIIQLSGGRENAAPGLAELRAQLTGQEPAEHDISVDDVVSARQGAGLLDGLIMHSCQSATEVYLAQRGGQPTASWARCVKPEGFFGAWATYSVYFSAPTAPLLDRYFCHEARRAAGERDLASTARAYVRSSELLMRMARLSGLDDAKAYKNRGGDVESLKADPSVIVHDEGQVRALDGIASFVDLAYAVKFGRETLASDLTKFICARQEYVRRHGVQDFADAPPDLPASPSVREINAVLRFYGRFVVSSALEAAVPGMVGLEKAQFALDEADPSRVKIDVSASISSSSQVDEALKFVQGVYGQRATDAVGNAVGSAMGGEVAGQLAPRVPDVMRAVAARVPDQLVDGNVQLELAKVLGEEENKLEPRVHGYRITVGDTTGKAPGGPAAPYQIHLSLSSVTRILRAAAMEMGGRQVELKQTISAARFLPSVTVYGYLRLHSVGDVSRIDASTIEVPLKWELNVNWGPFGDGYAYATSKVRLALGTGPGLSVRATPSVSVEQGSGWPAPKWVLRPILSAVTARINREIADRTREPVELSKLVPSAYQPEVSRAVRMQAVQVSDQVLSLYFGHGMDVALPLGMP